MANGDIKFEAVSEEKFRSFPSEQQQWFIYQTLSSLSCTCHERQVACDKRYVRRKHVIYVVIFAFGAFSVLGYKKDEIIGFIIEAAVKAAIAGVMQ